ncbi:MAG: sel1 repeat family protein [Oscillospiraceae bacterium]|nr:sel1 repeat family protein [Oscillospiraceae bacterium]
MNPELQFYVGVAYLSGWIPCNNHEKKAAMWFARSELQGCDKGALGLGYIREKGLAEYDPVNDYKNMVEDYTNAAKQGNVYAQYRLAKVLYQVDPDNPRLIQLLMNAVDAGYQPAKEFFDEVSFKSKNPIALEEYQKSFSVQRTVNLNYDELCAMLLEIHDNVQKIRPIVTANNEIIKRMEISVQMLQTSLDGMWTEMQEAEEEFRGRLQELQRGIHENLNKVPKEELKEAEEFMSVLFKGDWRNPARLCNESCDSLITAHVLMKMADKLEIRDYCGIVVTAVSALERECRRRFYDAFDSYLESIGVEAQDQKARMNLDKPFFTLGSVGSIVKSPAFEEFVKATKFLSPAAEKECAKRKFREHKDMIGYYCLPGTWEKNPKDGKNFTDLTWELTRNYRNPAAHADKIMTSEDAARCCDLLGITAAHKEVNNITGALKALLWLTAPLEQKE